MKAAARANPVFQRVRQLGPRVPLDKEDKMSVSVVHLTGRAGRSGMGLSSVVWGLSRAQLSKGEHIRIWCCDKAAALECAQEYGVPLAAIVPFPSIGPSGFCFSPPMRIAARESRNGLEVLHQHGIWTAVSDVANVWRRKHGPTVLAPHGSLEPWALRRSPVRKSLALRMFEGRNLREAGCLHATSIAEIGDIRNFGLKTPVALIPNGVSNDWLQSTGDSERFRKRFGVPQGMRIVFFLSRITPKKGLPTLVEAWATRRDRLREWCLVIAGTDECSHLSALAAQVEAASLGKSVMFLGPLYGAEKRDAFAACDVFALPSHSEGSPMAVLDALGAGVPVLTTQKTPWEDLHRHQCGWWVPDDAGGVGEALDDMCRRSPEELASWGARGRKLVSTSYSWDSAAARCASLYGWLLSPGPRPEFVFTN